MCYTSSTPSTPADSWQQACQLSHSLPHNCNQALVGFQTGIYDTAAALQCKTRKMLYQLSYVGLAVTLKHLMQLCMGFSNEIIE